MDESVGTNELGSCRLHESEPRRNTPGAAVGSELGYGRKSPVFEFFSIGSKRQHDGTHTMAWSCDLCINDTSWKDPPNTTNFWNHLNKRHKTEYDAIKGCAAQDSEANAVPPHAVFTKEQAETATAALIAWIVEDSQAFSVVAQERFRKFCAILQPGYTVPCRQTVRKKVEDSWKAEKAAARSVIKEELTTTGRRAAVTTDLWTSYARRGYMATTLHYITNDWYLRSALIGFKRTVYPHAGPRLGKRLLEATDEMHRDIAPHVWAVTADNASNNKGMVTTFNIERSLPPTDDSPPRATPFAHDSGVGYLRCFAHVIQLAVRSGIDKCNDINSALGGLREVVKKMSESPKLFQQYEVVCSSLDPPVKATKFKLDVDTRWDSTYDMVSHLLKSKPRLDDLLHRIYRGHSGFGDLSIDAALATKIGDREWAAVRLFYTFLKPFKEATVLSSGSAYPTMGCVSATYKALLYHTNSHVRNAERRLSRFQAQLAPAPDAFSTSAARQTRPPARGLSTGSDATALSELETVERNLIFFKAVQAKLTEYEHVSGTHFAVIAAGLDPRYKSLNPNLDAILIDEFKKNYQDLFDSDGQAQGSGGMFSPVRKPNALNGLIVKASGAASVSTSYRTIEDEVRAWLSMEGVPISKSAFEILPWWRSNESKFARLGMMAKDFLAIPATSVPSESAFSKAGVTVDKKRARLGDSAVQQLSELQSFLVFNQGAVKAAEIAAERFKALERRHRDECVLAQEEEVEQEEEEEVDEEPEAET